MRWKKGRRKKRCAYVKRCKNVCKKKVKKPHTCNSMNTSVTVQNRVTIWTISGRDKWQSKRRRAFVSWRDLETWNVSTQSAAKIVSLARAGQNKYLYCSPQRICSLFISLASLRYGERRQKSTQILYLIPCLFLLRK